MTPAICKNCYHWQPNGGVLGYGYCKVQKWVYRKPTQTCKRFAPVFIIDDKVEGNEYRVD